MKYKNLIFITTSLFFLNGCVETTAFLGPAITGMSTGSVYEAGLSYGANSVVKNKTGQSTVDHITQLLEKDDKRKDKNKLNNDFIELVEKRVKSTRAIIYPEIN